MIPRFRAWIKEKRKMVNVLAINFRAKEVELDIETEDGQYYSPVTTWSLDDVVLMQSTGLFDKNGVEIYEGDIIKCEKEWFGGLWAYPVNVVEYVEGSFFADIYRLHEYDELEVIGNIYETQS